MGFIQISQIIAAPGRLLTSVEISPLLQIAQDQMLVKSEGRFSTVAGVC
jgi:hypothetical protein